MELLNDSGLSSLSGFSYQIKVFILRLTQLQQGQRVEFETLDDVAVRSLSSKDSISDSCFKWKVDETSSIEVFQVKQTNVSESVRRQVLYDAFTEAAIQESKSYSDRQFLREVISIV